MISSKTEIITKDEAKIMFYAMVISTYLQGIVEGINYAVPYSDATELAKSRTSKSIMEMVCKNIFENRTFHGFDSDYKWQVMKLTSKKHSKIKQQFWSIDYVRDHIEIFNMVFKSLIIKHLFETS